MRRPTFLFVLGHLWLLVATPPLADNVLRAVALGVGGPGATKGWLIRHPYYPPLADRHTFVLGRPVPPPTTTPLRDAHARYHEPSSGYRPGGDYNDGNGNGNSVNSNGNGAIASLSSDDQSSSGVISDEFVATGGQYRRFPGDARVVEYVGPTVKVFDPIPIKFPGVAKILRNPVVSGVLQQTGSLVYSPFFSQSFLLNFFFMVLYTFLTLIPAGIFLAMNQATLRYAQLRNAARGSGQTPPLRTIFNPAAQNRVGRSRAGG